ncbi:hypothetical protein [Pontibacter flavimaris]|uniref:STAS/SEC14 domain-containing protein n=1 Tax=Pontibacter flavimaris TaxID=1797110 RepID=A0A1Q5PDM9_9BACT|nr:hypothetical protein [Pontibacter flavimaris]OKL40326.1 hypothetical protein A3841_18565 [Pontibacter flavimaris]
MTSAELPEYLTSRIVPEEDLLHITWMRPVSTEEYREGLHAIKQLILDQSTRLWLADSRRLSHVTFEDQQWIIKELIPLLLKSQLQKVARVVKADVFTYISFENMMSKAQENLNVHVQMEQFTTVESALGWLRMQD